MSIDRLRRTGSRRSLIGEVGFQATYKFRPNLMGRARTISCGWRAWLWRPNKSNSSPPPPTSHRQRHDILPRHDAGAGMDVVTLNLQTKTRRLRCHSEPPRFEPAHPRGSGEPSQLPSCATPKLTGGQTLRSAHGSQECLPRPSCNLSFQVWRLPPIAGTTLRRRRNRRSGRGRWQSLGKVRRNRAAFLNEQLPRQPVLRHEGHGLEELALGRVPVARYRVLETQYESPFGRFGVLADELLQRPELRACTCLCCHRFCTRWANRESVPARLPRGPPSRPLDSRPGRTIPATTADARRHLAADRWPHDRPTAPRWRNRLAGTPPARRCNSPTAPGWLRAGRAVIRHSAACVRQRPALCKARCRRQNRRSSLRCKGIIVVIARPSAEPYHGHQA